MGRSPKQSPLLSSLPSHRHPTHPLLPHILLRLLPPHITPPPPSPPRPPHPDPLRRTPAPPPAAHVDELDLGFEVAPSTDRGSAKLQQPIGVAPKRRVEVHSLMDLAVSPEVGGGLAVAM
ncbi:hypothetical protein K440DRAFT_632442 [Wilcoxina mikolae CBS 423.85]|nr:hypothetical protein K440DRAFT_632442 [Wilcoxina mikolae CBS 423.85]